MGKFEAGSGPSNDISSSTDFKINVSVDQKTSERLRNVGTIPFGDVVWGEACLQMIKFQILNTSIKQRYLSYVFISTYSFRISYKYSITENTIHINSN